MRQSTKVERPRKTSSPVTSLVVEIDDAISWLSQHMGFPAPSREQYEARFVRRRRRA